METTDRERALSARLVRFLAGEAASDNWERRRLRLTRLQEEQWPGVVAHALRVAENAAALASEIGLPASEVEAIRTACVLHDVGKIAVRQEVLHKAGALDDLERREMRLHAAFGFGLLDVPGAPAVTLDIVKYHHERYHDGKGYFGLAREDIPFAARIAAVADVHEALTAKREYKPPMPEAEALAMMVSDGDAPGIGRKAFDPVLLRRFVAMRLRDPSFGATPAARQVLAGFAKSDPNLDFGFIKGGPVTIRIDRAGNRLQYDVDDRGHRVLASLTFATGARTTSFRRLDAYHAEAKPDIRL